MNEKSGGILVSIHQPNLFPWLGFFNKISRSDFFVYLDHVENNSRDPLWTKRVKVLVNRKEFWLTIPIKNTKEQIFCPINKMMILSPARIAAQHLKTIEFNYKKAPFFNEVFPIILDFYNHKSDSISERNIIFAESICQKLHISTKRMISSTMGCKNKLNDLLIEIIQKAGGTDYLFGGLGDKYQEPEKFASANIRLIPQGFVHPVYPQFNSAEFVKGLSILDPLMNVGFDGVRRLIK
jgi:hypothetical protein